MSIDPASIGTGIVSGYVTQKGIEATRSVLEKPEPSRVEQLLEDILHAIAPPEKESINESFQLMPYPSEYVIADNFHDRAHVCVFFFDSNVPVRFDGVFGGTYQRNVGPGWFQVDVPGRLSVNGGTTNHPVVVSYRNDALGSSF